MKSLGYLPVILLCAVGLAVPAVAELQPLGGASVGTTLAAPELPKFINDKDNIPRTFAQQPPLTPHINERYPINLHENKCLECHMKQPGKDEAKSVMMSDSHFVDRDGNQLEQPAGNRWFCNQCHVPQIDAEPLVGNLFRPVPTQ